jgi:hypothetical protein
MSDPREMFTRPSLSDAEIEAAALRGPTTEDTP